MDFHWSEGDDFFPHVSYFPSTGSGITDNFELPQNAQVYDYFLQYFDDELLDRIVTETNRYSQQKTQASSCQSHERKWCSLIVNELEIFLALTILMSHTHKAVLCEYWII